MRHRLSFSLQDLELCASLDGGTRDLGVLFVTGGTEIRSGAHGGLAQLAARLAETGYPVFRFDRRGVGDSDGEDPGFAGSGEDLAAAAAAFRGATPGLHRIVGLGLCDGATALALHGAALDLAGLILLNPWAVETTDDLPPPTAIRQRYVERLTSVDGWRRLLSGSIDYRRLSRGILSIMRPPRSHGLAERMGRALAANDVPVELIVARRDATAAAFFAAWGGAAFRAVRRRASTHLADVDSRSHSFARGDEPALLARLCLDALGRIDARG